MVMLPGLAHVIAIPTTPSCTSSPPAACGYLLLLLPQLSSSSFSSSILHVSPTWSLTAEAVPASTSISMRPAAPSPPASLRHFQNHYPSDASIHWPRFDSQQHPSFVNNYYYHPPPSLRSTSSTAMDLNSLPPGSLLTYGDPSEFDYAAFLQATDANPHASSATSAPGYPLIPALAPVPNHNHTPGAPTPLALFSDSPRVGTPPSSDSTHRTSHTNRASSVGSGELSRSSNTKQRLERRGHTKSRRGCYNCKRRRIKVRREQSSWRPLLTDQRRS